MASFGRVRVLVYRAEEVVRSLVSAGKGSLIAGGVTNLGFLGCWLDMDVVTWFSGWRFEVWVYGRVMWTRFSVFAAGRLGLQPWCAMMGQLCRDSSLDCLVIV